MSATSRDRFYASQDATVQRDWKAHRDLLVQVPRAVSGFRGFLGLGAILDNQDKDAWLTCGNQFFVPDHDLTWLTLQDLPRGVLAPRRETHLAVVRRTRSGYDIPRIGDIVTADDFRGMPIPPAGGFTPEQERVLAALNALNWGMTAAAAQHTPGWAVLREPLAALGIVGLALVGPPAWLPAPYLGFPEARRRELWKRSTVADALGSERYYPDAMRKAFLADLTAGLPIVAPAAGRVLRIDRRARRDELLCTAIVMSTPHGTEIEVVARRDARLIVGVGYDLELGAVMGHDGPILPEDWHGASAHARWTRILPGLLGPALIWVLRTWFTRWMRSLVPGYVHVPAALAAPAALGCANPTQLIWDLGPGIEYFQEPADALVFPPIRTAAWDRFRLRLTGDLELDITPPEALHVETATGEKDAAAYHAHPRGDRP